LAKVLIVDDDRNTVKLLQTLLELDGFQVSIAPRGADVIPAAEKTPPDLIMMDYHLADMDGVEVIQKLRAHERFAKTPILVASGLDVGDEVLAAGANKFIVKPFEPGDLPGIFKSLMQNQG
jgi:DNA-binding response OmpR family regulator